MGPCTPTKTQPFSIRSVVYACVTLNMNNINWQCFGAWDLQLYCKTAEQARWTDCNEFVFDDQEELQMFLDLNEDGKEEFSPVDTVLNKEKSMKY